jgi:uncharacterized membrane protein
MEIVNVISLGIGCIGVAVIVWGALATAVSLGVVELKAFSGKDVLAERHCVRQRLGFYLLMGLEYMIGADIVRTLVRPTLQELAVLGALVAIRTVTSYFLNKEMNQNFADDSK